MLRKKYKGKEVLELQRFRDKKVDGMEWNEAGMNGKRAMRT